MTDIQTFFSLVYGIYFAATVGATGKFRPFDTAAACVGDWQALCRLGLAFLFLNVLPLIYFLFVFRRLEDFPAGIADSIPMAFGVLFAGVGGAGIYRIFGGLMLVQAHDKWVFYSDHPPLVQPRSPWPHVAGGLIWLAVCLGAFEGLRFVA